MLNGLGQSAVGYQTGLAYFVSPYILSIRITVYGEKALALELWLL